MSGTTAHRLCFFLAIAILGADSARLPDVIMNMLTGHARAAAGPAAVLQKASSRDAFAPPPPNFPDAYEMEYVFSMPYFLLLQPGGLSYKVHVWVDKAREAVRVDFRGGIDKTYFIEDKEYSVTPHRHDLVCKEYSHSGGPIRQQPSSTGSPVGMLGKQVLPDMSPWADMGPAEVDDTPARMYTFKEMAGEKVNTYTFYIGQDGAPLKFHSVGQDFFQGSHYDEYVYKWTSYKPGPIDPAVFDLPDICKDLPTAAQQQHQQQQQQQQGGGSDVAASTSSGRHHQVHQAIALLPGNHGEHADEAHYHLHSLLHGRQHTSSSTYLTALEAFRANKAKVLDHNRASAPGSHTLELNHFADWTREEFDRVMLPLKWRRDHGFAVQRVRPAPLRTFNASLQKHQLPKHWDWRATPADFAVKDQGQCGSCWAFAAVGTMEGSWFTATGRARSFSEQQLIDCAWPHGPHGCDGGDYQPGFRYVAALGGIAATQDYPYVGQNDYCREDTTKMSGHFDGYVEVASKDEVAVMEALMKHGPLAVGVDASFDEFLFYSEGIYRDKRCSLKPSELNHAVILVGWGTDKHTHEPYWVIKNSWSKFWGDDGYIKIHRSGNDCGIASDAAFAAVSPQYVVPGAAEAAQQAVMQAMRSKEGLGAGW